MINSSFFLKTKAFAGCKKRFQIQLTTLLFSTRSILKHTSAVYKMLFGQSFSLSTQFVSHK